MTDEQISGFIAAQRPDYVDYYNSSIKPGAHANASDPGLLIWARQQMAVAPSDQAQFSTWVAQGDNANLGSNPPPATPPGTPPPPSVGGGISSLVNPPANVQEALDRGVAASGGPGNNTNQVQSGSQQGGYSSQGQQTQVTDQTQHVAGTQVQDTTGTQKGTTSTAGTQTGTTSGTSTSTSGVNDTLGLGALIQNQTAGAGAADATRRAELTKIATQGGAGLQSQLDQGIRNARTGPRMVGAGASSNDRAAGYAAAQIGRTDLDARLGALQQLSGPTASGNLVTQGMPLLNKTESNANTGSSNLASVGTQIQDLVNTNKSFTGSTQDTTSAGHATDNTSQAGTATGSNLNIATGQTPQQQQSSGGGCFVASALASLKLIGPRGIRKAVRYKLDRYKYMPIGYALYGPWLAKQVLKHSWVRRLMLPVVRGILFQELRLAGKTTKVVPVAWTTHLIFHYGSAALGWVASQFGARFETKDIQLRSILQQHDLFFQQ